MTAPLTPADCDLTDFAFMPLEVARLRRSKAWLICKRNPALAFYMLNLWTACWHERPAGSLENDDDVLADFAMCDPAKWAKVKTDALRGWVLCDDGRYYHPTVCEKVVEAWNAKLDQRWRTECARIKKHNDRHHTSVPRPTFEEWVEAGCPQGQRLPVPRDTPGTGDGQGGEIDSKGQGEGQRQGQGQGDIEEKDTHTGGTALPENFALPKAWGVWSIEEFPHWTPEVVRSIADQFADHHRAAATLSADWAATWRKWCRDDLTQRAHPAAKPKPAAAPVPVSNTVPSNGHVVTQAALAEAEAERVRIASMTPEQRAEVSRVARETSARLKSQVAA